MDASVRDQLIEGLVAASVVHETFHKALVRKLSAWDGSYDPDVVIEARDAALQYVAAASELKGYYWALRLAASEQEIADMESEALERWDHSMNTVDLSRPLKVFFQDDE